MEGLPRELREWFGYVAYQNKAYRILLTPLAYAKLAASVGNAGADVYMDVGT